MAMKSVQELHNGELLRQEINRTMSSGPPALVPIGGAAPSSSRILHDIPCKVCQDHSSGKHYGIFACDGCAGFFKRSVRRSRQYFCKSKRSGTCIIDKTHRNQCRACRLNKCLDAGMNKDAVQHERGPRNSTLRRQYMKEPSRSAPLTPVATTLPAPPMTTSPIPISMMPSVAVSEEVYCEVAARLLIMNVKWVRQASGSFSLSMYDRILLLEESWRELFVLGAAVLMPSMVGFKRVPGSLILREAVEAVALAQLNENELACLRAIVLFQPRSRLTDPRAVAALQDHAQIVLNKHISAMYPDVPLRFENLMMLLSMLRMVRSSTIEEMFFTKTIGNIPIERIIGNMYRNEKKTE